MLPSFCVCSATSLVRLACKFCLLIPQPEYILQSNITLSAHFLAPAAAAAAAGLAAADAGLPPAAAAVSFAPAAVAGLGPAAGLAPAATLPAPAVAAAGAARPGNSPISADPPRGANGASSPILRSSSAPAGSRPRSVAIRSARAMPDTAAPCMLPPSSQSPQTPTRETGSKMHSTCVCKQRRDSSDAACCG